MITEDGDVRERSTGHTSGVVKVLFWVSDARLLNQLLHERAFRLEWVGVVNATLQLSVLIPANKRTIASAICAHRPVNF